MAKQEKNTEIQPELIQNIHWCQARAYALQTALELDIFTHIHAGVNTPERLAKHYGSNFRALRIFMDALVGMGLLVKGRDVYKLSMEAKTFLVKEEPNYLGRFLLGVKKAEDKWKHLTEVVKTGQPAAHMEDPQKSSEFFGQLVQAIFPTSFASGVILSKKLGAGKTWSSLKILDLGCGAAAWSLAFTLADPQAQVVAVDLPEVLEVAKQQAQRLHATKQYEFRPGNYHELSFEKEHYDAVILGHICHMEGEGGTKKLLKKSYHALKPGGKILVAEYLSNDQRTGPELPLLFALNMLILTEKGDVFTNKDMKRWLELAGFKKISAQAVQYPATVMVGVK